MLQTMDLARFIQIFIIQLSIGGIYYFIIAYLILRRSTKRLNQIFAMFFITVALGTVVNVIYAPLTTNPLVLILHILTYFLLCFGQIFLLVFGLMILKSEKIITTSKQLLMILVFAALLSVFFIIGMTGGVQIDASTDWKPVWNLTFFLYAILICTFVAIIPTIYFSLKIYNQFEDPQLKKKWKYYLIGTCFYYFVWFGTSLSNFLNIAAFRTMWSLIALVVIISTYLIYYGVGKQI